MVMHCENRSVGDVSTGEGWNHHLCHIFNHVRNNYIETCHNLKLQLQYLLFISRIKIEWMEMSYKNVKKERAQVKALGYSKEH